MKVTAPHVLLICIIFIFMALMAYTYGVSRVMPDCPPQAIDCTPSIRLSPVFWYPRRFTHSGFENPYIIPTPPVGTLQDHLPDLLITLLYWFILANTGSYLILKVLRRKR